MYDRNHEGYHDPTACMAIRNVMCLQETSRLTYQIREAYPVGISGTAEGGDNYDQRGACDQNQGWN